MTPTIELFGLTISEPVTMGTDYLVAVVAWWLGAKLLARASTTTRARLLWGTGFLWIGLGAFLGGTSHGFATYLDGTASFVIWKATVYSIGLSVAFALAGSIAGTIDEPSLRRRLLWLNAIAFGAYAIWMVKHSAFVFVVIHYVPVMLSIAVLHAIDRQRRHAPSAPWMVAGVLATLVGAVIQQSGFTLHRHFNHNDLYHLIQVAGLVLFYCGIIRFN